MSDPTADLETILRDHGGLEGLARIIGRDPDQPIEYTTPDNDDDVPDAPPSWRSKGLATAMWALLFAAAGVLFYCCVAVGR